MKTTLSILSLIIFWSAAKAEDVIVNRIYFGGDDRMDFLVPREELLKVHDWEPEDEQDAPLSRNQALEIASKAAVAEGLDISGTSELVISLTRMNPFEERLLKRLPPGCCRWFYMVEFKRGYAELMGKFTFLVTMSGTVATKRAE